MPHEWHEGGFTVSDDAARLDVGAIHDFLTRCYWAEGIPRATVERSIAHSINFGAYEGATQVGYARVISDRATVAYLGDVFVLETWRGRGLSRFLMRCVVAHPELQGLRRWLLATRDAHGLYAKFGFAPFAKPDRWMERHDPDVYRRG